MSPLGDEEALLVAKEAVQGSTKIGIGRVEVSECLLKLVVEGFAFFIVPLVQVVGSKL
jgi:hypothetical protein